jgi:hypothetical protein
MKSAIRLTPVFVLLAAVAAGEPFSAEWNWERQKIHGPVKSVTTGERVGRRYEEYGKDGRKLLALLYDELGKVTNEFQLKHNKNGDLNQVTFLKKGREKPLYVERADYKSKGVLKSVTRVIGDKLMKSESIVYGKDGRVKSVSIKTGKNLTTWSYRFDKDGNLIGFELTQGRKSMVRAEYSKHEKGNATVMKSYRQGKLASEATVSYKYDSHGNWTEMKAKPILYTDGKKTERPAHITTRKIEYYK